MKNFRAMIRMFHLSTVFVLCSHSLSAEDRVWVDVKINGKPVKFVLATAANRPILFRPAAERLGLHITNSPAGPKVPQGQVSFDLTEVCDVSVSGMTDRVSFAVVDLPDAISYDEDGVLGWPMLSQAIVQFDCLNDRCKVLERVPEDVSHWTRLKVKRGAEVLTLEFEDQAGKGAIIVNTGATGGVALAPLRWKEWIASHPGRNRTIRAYFEPAAGLVVQEQAWANEFTLGSLVLFDVPVRETNLAEARNDSSAYLGMTALKRLNLVVDGRNGIAYVRSTKSPPLPYSHNRAGVVFVPTDVEKSTYLTAHVLPGTPAYEANVRDDDVLLKIDDLDATQWRTDPALKRPNSCFEDRPAGSKIRLTLKRGADKIETTVVLRDLLGAEAVTAN